jgi:hypothetical protein
MGFFLLSNSTIVQVDFKWTSSGLQVDFKWTSSGLQVDFKYTASENTFLLEVTNNQ